MGRYLIGEVECAGEIRPVFASTFETTLTTFMAASQRYDITMSVTGALE